MAVNFTRTLEAIDRLEETICCDKCTKRSNELLYIGSCDHWFCGQCLSSKTVSCPVCEIPLDNKRPQPIPQLTEIARSCASMRKQLQNRNGNGWTPTQEANAAGRPMASDSLVDAGATVDPDAIIQQDIDMIDYGPNLDVEMAAGDQELALSKLGAGGGQTSAPKTVVTALRPKEIGLAYSTLPNEDIRKIINMVASGSYGPNVHLIPCTTVDLEGSTHLVVRGSPTKRSYKYFLSVLSGKWIITFDWISACLKEGRLVDEEPFEVGGSSNNPESGGPKRARQNAQMAKPGLFSGCEIFLCGQFRKPNLTMAQVKTLIQLGGGEVRGRPPSNDVDDTESETRPYHAGHENWKSNSLIVFQGRRDQLQLPRHADGVPQVPLSWLLDCIDHYQLLPFPSDESAN